MTQTRIVDLTTKQVAVMLGITAGQVRGLVTRGLLTPTNAPKPGAHRCFFAFHPAEVERVRISRIVDMLPKRRQKAQEAATTDELLADIRHQLQLMNESLRGVWSFLQGPGERVETALAHDAEGLTPQS